MIEEASKFFRDVAAPRVGGPIAYISQLERKDFIGGMGMAIFHLIKEVATTALNLVTNLFTLINDKNFVTTLQQSAKLVMAYATAIPLGMAGALFPKEINEKVLGIPAHGLFIQRII